MSSQDGHAALLLLIDRFLTGEERSRRLVAEIEGIMVRYFRDADWFDEVELSLALYAPAEKGGSYLADDDLERVLHRVRDRLDADSEQ